MGIMLYFMVTAQMPFRAENVAKLRKTIVDGNYSIPSFVSNQCQELIRKVYDHSSLLNY
jgi:serine/threonine-protein kinase NIM1